MKINRYNEVIRKYKGLIRDLESREEVLKARLKRLREKLQNINITTSLQPNQSVFNNYDLTVNPTKFRTTPSPVRLIPDMDECIDNFYGSATPYTVSQNIFRSFGPIIVAHDTTYCGPSRPTCNVIDQSGNIWSPHSATGVADYSASGNSVYARVTAQQSVAYGSDQVNNYCYCACRTWKIGHAGAIVAGGQAWASATFKVEALGIFEGYMLSISQTANYRNSYTFGSETYSGLSGASVSINLAIPGYSGLNFYGTSNINISASDIREIYPDYDGSKGIAYVANISVFAVCNNPYPANKMDGGCDAKLPSACSTNPGYALAQASFSYSEI